MNRLLKTLLTTFTILTGIVVAGTVYAQPTIEVTEVIGNILQLQPDRSFVIVAETTFATLEECWAAALEVNQAQGAGFVAVCWPYPTTVPAT